MKRFSQVICLLLILSIILVNPVFATENTTRESGYFGSRLAYLYPTSGSQFQVWIEVVSTSTMDKLGASSITVQCSSDNANWSDVGTYTMSSYTNLIRSKTTHHEAYVTCTGTSGYYYRAEVTFYAKKGNGTAEYDYTTESIRLS